MTTLTIEQAYAARPVIVRSRDAGVLFGTYAGHDGSTVATATAPAAAPATATATAPAKATALKFNTSTRWQEEQMNKTPEIYYVALAFDFAGNHLTPETETDLADMVVLVDGEWCRINQVWQFERKADGSYAATDANEIVARAWLEANSNWVVSGGHIPDFIHEHAPDDLADLLVEPDVPERSERDEHSTLHHGGSGVL